jgi:hypothetical protein
MYGNTAGDSPYGGEAPYWRAIVEATGANDAPGDVLGLGNPIVQSTAPADGDVNAAAAPVAIGQALGDVTADGASVLTAVSLMVATAEVAQDGSVSAAGVVVIESSAATTADAASQSQAVAIGSSGADASAEGGSEFVGGAIAMGGSSIVSAAAELEFFMSSGEAVPLFERLPPEMLPLVNSAEYDVLETELKNLFIQLFETHIRADERYVNVLGMPQQGPRELIEASLANDGLSIYRGAQSAGGAGAYLLRAWRAHNPKRGTALLETYLQLLWPNVWTATQMWQDKDPLTPYPTGLAETDEGDHYLTSRVNVSLPSRVTSGGDLAAIQQGLRASLPARIVMNLAIETDESFGIGIATAYYPGLVAQSYEGTIA